MAWCIRRRRAARKHGARGAPRRPVDDAGNEARREKSAASNPHFTSRWVGKKLNILHALVQVIEYGCSTIEQRAAILGWLDAVRAAVEQLHAKSMFEFSN